MAIRMPLPFECMSPLALPPSLPPQPSARRQGSINDGDDDDDYIGMGRVKSACPGPGRNPSTATI